MQIKKRLTRQGINYVLFIPDCISSNKMKTKRGEKIIIKGLLKKNTIFVDI